jgi:hypothetical protein
MEQGGGYGTAPGQGRATGSAPGYEPEQKRDLLPVILAAIAVVLGLGAIAVGVTALTREAEAPPQEVPPATIPDGSIGARQLADGSVTSEKIADQAVERDRVANGAIGEAKLANGAVTGPKVRENALGGGQIDESTLAKVPLAAAADTAKTAEVATTLEGFDPGSLAPSVETAQATSVSSPDDVKAATATCPDGSQLISGGAVILAETEQPALPIALTASTPDGAGWTAQAFEIVPTDSSWSLQVTAVCASFSGG